MNCLCQHSYPQHLDLGDVSTKKIISVVGVTAGGKTALSIALAKKFNACVLSFDSRQCYRELSIGTAKPTFQERGNIPHYFIDTHSIFDSLTVKDFVNYAHQTLNSIFKDYSLVILVGGTGLFWTALCYGLDEIPQVPLSLRESIRADYASYGLDWLKTTLQNEDPLYAVEGEMQNPQRMMRALEIVRHTGQSIKTFQTNSNTPALPYAHTTIGLKFADSDERRKIITQRIHAMMQCGLKKEAMQYVNELPLLNSLQTVGYKEWINYANGSVDEEETVCAIIRNTIDYAKRQVTWFKRYPNIVWFERNIPHPKIVDYLQKTI